MTALFAYVYVAMGCAELAGALMRIGRWPGARECAVLAALSVLWPVAFVNRRVRGFVRWLRECVKE